MHQTRATDVPFHTRLSSALEELLRQKPGVRRRAKEWHAALGQPRFTEGQVKTQLEWLAERGKIKAGLGGRANRSRYYWAEPKED